MKPKQIILILVPCLITVAALAIFSGDWIGKDWIKREELPSVSTALLASFFICLQLLFQSLRFLNLLPQSTRPSFMKVARVYFWGQAVNGWIPFRGGDALKAYQLREAGLASVVGGLVAERVVDIAALGLLAVMFLGVNDLLMAVPLGYNNTILLIAVILSLVAVTLYLMRNKWGDKYKSISNSLAPLRNPRAASISLFFAILAWAAEAFALQALAKNAAPLTLEQSLGSLLLLNLAIAVPVMPANVGAFEGGLAFALQKNGFSWETGLAIATIHHALQLSMPLLLVLIWSFFKEESKPSGISIEDKDKAIRYYQNKAVGGYDENVSKGILSHFRNSERNAVLKLADNFSSGKTMIDVGCGGGFFTRRAKEAGLRVTAVDICPKMLKQVEGIADETKLADLDSLEISHPFDWVVCAGVLDFVRDPEAAYLRLAALVKPGGSLLILAPRTGVGGFYYRIEKWLSGGFNVNLYSRAWFESLKEKSGLTLTRMEKPLPTNMAIQLVKPLTVDTTVVS